MHCSVVTQKGQVTIPSDIRKTLQISEGDKVMFEVIGSEIIVTLMRKSDLNDLCGFLPKPKKSLTIDQMNEIINSKI